MGPLHDQGGDRRSEAVQVDNVKLKGGNQATYTLKRLKRDHPALFAKVVAGELTAAVFFDMRVADHTI